VQEKLSSQQPAQLSLTDWLRKIFSGVLDSIAGFFLHIGLTPDSLTIIGLVGNIGAALLLARGNLLQAGIVAGLMGPLDAIDGSMARQLGEPTRFGGFLDSVVDRYSEIILFTGALYYYINLSENAMILWVFAAAMGSVLVSYTRARGEALGFTVKKGFLTRVERFIIFIGGLLFGILTYAIIVVAIFANITAFQRILIVYRQAKNNDGN